MINFFLAGSLNQLWALIRSQQIIVLMPLYNVSLPANAGFFFKTIMQIAAFEIIEMNEKYVSLTGESSTALSSNFLLIGFDSMWFINNLSTLGIVLISIPLVYLVRPLLVPFKKKLWAYKIKKYLKKTLYWSFPYRMIHESYLIILICTMINMRWLYFETLWNSINSLITITFFIFALAIPLAAGYLLYKYKE